jgi:hypothetical protein|tara:strand:+ start:4432 stop:4629 length:198 start_codon:yes stop_codon:yes gene_type:complete
LGPRIFSHKEENLEKMDYIITIPIEDGTEEELAFPDTENMYGFLNMLVEDGKDISEIIIPMEGYV